MSARAKFTENRLRVLVRLARPKALLGRCSRCEPASASTFRTRAVLKSTAPAAAAGRQSDILVIPFSQF